MNEPDVLTHCTRILRELLSDESIHLTMETTRDRVPHWDSLAYVTFIVAVEAEFGVKFGVTDVESFETVGAIVRRIGALQRSS